MSRNRPVSASSSSAVLAFSRRSPRAASASGLRSPGRQRLQEPPAAAAHQVRDHCGDLQQRVLQDLLDPVLVPDPVIGQVRPQPGQRPQVPDGLRRHERAAQHAPFVQLAQPHAVQPVGLGPAGQVPDVAGVDQPHFQARRLRQVIPDPPVVAGGLRAPAAPRPGTPGDPSAPRPSVPSRSPPRPSACAAPAWPHAAAACTPSRSPWPHRPPPPG